MKDPEVLLATMRRLVGSSGALYDAWTELDDHLCDGGELPEEWSYVRRGMFVMHRSME